MTRPKKQMKIVLNNVCNAIFSDVDLRRAIRWYSCKPVFRFKKVFISAKYPCVAIYDKKIHIHRLLMMYWLKRDLASWENVHHKNKNTLDSTKENLEVVSASQHQSDIHKGKKLSKQHIEAIKKSNSKRKGIKYKKFENPELLK